MFVVDTNILLHAVRRESTHHETAITLIKKWQREATPWHSTLGIFYEFLRVSTHRAVFRNPLKADQAISFLNAFLTSPNFTLLEHHKEHFSLTKKLIDENPHLSGNIWHDVHTIILMQEHGIQEIITADSDFHRFTGIKVTNPLQK